MDPISMAASLDVVFYLAFPLQPRATAAASPERGPPVVVGFRVSIAFVWGLGSSLLGSSNFGALRLLVVRA